MLLFFRPHGNSAAAVVASSTLFNTPPMDQYLRVDLTLMDITTGATKTITLLDRNPPVSYSTSPSYTEGYTILKSTSGLGLAVGQSGVPVETQGAFVVSDPMESIGEERRLFDLLERYTPVEQPVTVYYYVKRIEDAFDPTAWTTMFVGVVKSVSKGFDDDDDLSFTVSSIPIPDVVITKQIDSDVIGGSDQGSNGRYLPLVIGNTPATEPAFVPAILTRQPTTEVGPAYYYATARGTETTGFLSDTLNASIMFKDHEGTYRSINTLDNNLVQVGDTGATTATPFGTTENAIDVTDNVAFANGFCYTWLRMWFKGQNNVALTPAGDIIFRLYQLDADNGNPGELLATATVPKSDYYSGLQGASGFYVSAAFDKPVVDVKGRSLDGVAAGKRIVLAYVLSSYATSTTDFVPGLIDPIDSVPRWTRTDSGEWTKQTATTDHPAIEIGGLFRTDITSPAATNSDLYALGFQLNVAAYFTSFPSTLALPVMSFDILVHNTGGQVLDTGLSHPTPGLITGSPLAEIERPEDVFAFLLATWDGTKWALPSNLDMSHFAALYTQLDASDTSPLLMGPFEGRITIGDALQLLCSHTGGKVIQLTNGKLAFWLPAPSREDYLIGTLWDEDFKIKSWRKLDSTSVVNQIQIYYQKELRHLNDAAGAATGEFAGFRGSQILKSDTTVESGMFSAISDLIYGDRPLANTQFPLLKDEVSAKKLAHHLLRTFDHPHDVVSIETDFYESRTFELLDVVDLLSVKLPAYYGTAPAAALPTYSGASVEFANGEYWKRAKRHRCEVVSRRNDWQRGKEISLDLDLRVITPGHPNEPV